jgi:hypothetical protein
MDVLRVIILDTLRRGFGQNVSGVSRLIPKLVRPARLEREAGLTAQYSTPA